MKKCGFIIIAVCLSLAFVGYGIAVYAAGKDTKEETVTKETPKDPAKAEAKAAPGGGENAATVNGKAITKKDYEDESARIERQMGAMGNGKAPDPAQVSAMKKKVLENLIGREVLRQETERLGMKTTPEELKAQVDALKKRFPAETDFQSALEKMNLTEDSLKVQLSQDMTIKKLIEQEVASKITISDADVKTFYDGNPEVFKTPEMVRASHILVAVKKDASAEDKAKALEKIKAVRKKIVDGADFAQTAKEVSDCPSKDNGGDLDFFQKGQMVGPFEDTAFALKTDQLSDVVETEYGYHIIKVTDRRGEATASLDEMKDRIEGHLKQEKVNEATIKFVDQLKTKAKIETFIQ
jgi:peptidyl-prolyl cis-trans isomerase C